MITVTDSPVTSTASTAQVTTYAAAKRDSAMPVVADPTALGALMDRMQKGSGASLNEIGRRMGVTLQTVNQYRNFRRGKGIQLKTFLRYAAACGYRLVVEP